MKITILTLFPDMFAPITSQSILGKANEKKILDISLVNIRDFTLDKHNRTDDTPFGGGAGMVMSAEPIFRALSSVCNTEDGGQDAKNNGKRLIYLSPRGRLLDQELIEELSKEKEIVILCGHYEGVDQRIIDAWDMEEVSIGDYILTGGELPAMILVDSVARMVPEVIGSAESHKEESIYSGLLEYSQYTKPREYMGRKVPEVLFSGDHKKIHLWKFENSLKLTKERRPDLLKAFTDKVMALPKGEGLTKEERNILVRILDE